MKKQIWKRGIAFVLACCMVLGLSNGVGPLWDVKAEETTTYNDFTWSSLTDPAADNTAYGNGDAAKETARYVKLNDQYVLLDGSRFSGYVTLSEAATSTTKIWNWGVTQWGIGMHATNFVNTERYDNNRICFALKYSGDATYLAYAVVCGTTSSAVKYDTVTEIPVQVNEELFLQVSFDYIDSDNDGDEYDLQLCISAKGHTETVVYEDWVKYDVDNEYTRYASIWRRPLANQSITARSVHELTASITDGAVYKEEQEVNITTAASDGLVEKDLASVKVDGTEVSYSISGDGTNATFTLSPKATAQTVEITNKMGVTTTYSVTVKERNHFTWSSASVADGTLTAGSSAAERSARVQLDDEYILLDGSKFSGYVAFSNAGEANKNLTNFQVSQIGFGSTKDNGNYTSTSIRFALKYSGDNTYLAYQVVVGGTIVSTGTLTNIPVAVNEELFLQVSFDYIDSDGDGDTYDLQMIITAKGQTKEVVVVDWGSTDATNGSTRYASIWRYLCANQSIATRSVHDLEANITDGGTYYGKQKVMITTPATDGNVSKDIAGVSVNGQEVPYRISEDATGKKVASVELLPSEEEQTIVIENLIGSKVTYTVTVNDLGGRTAFTFRDLQGGLKHDGSSTSTTGAKKGYRPLGLVDTVFSGYVTFPTGGNIRYSTAQNSEGNSGGTYLQIYRVSNNLKLFKSSTKEDTIVNTSMSTDGTQEHFLQIVNTAGENACTIDIYLDGTQITKATTTIDSDKLGCGLSVQYGTSVDTVWRSAEADIELEERTYDLADGEAGYLLTGKGTFCVDGEHMAAGEALSEVGTYQAERTLDGAAYVRTVNVIDSRSDDVQIPALTYDYLGGDEVMPVVGFYVPDTKTINEETVSYTTDKIYQLIKDSGINLISWTQTAYDEAAPTSVENQLRLAAKYGLGMYVNDNRVNALSTEEAANTSAVGYLKAYSSFESYLGNMLRDEPAAADYYMGTEAPAKTVEDFTGIGKFMNQYNNLTGFINLLPMIDDCNKSTSEQTLEAVYKSYVQTCVNSTNPKVISFDRYPTTYDFKQEGDTWVLTNSKDFYTNLSIIREQAADKLPFWTFVETGDFANEENSGQRQIKGEEILWYVNTALAYGSKGIEYYTVVETGDGQTLGDDGATKSGIIDVNGNKTKWYATIKEANDQIQAVDHVLMKSINQGVVATDGYVEANITGSEKITDTTAYNVESITTTGTTYGALTGVFKYYPDTTQSTAYDAYYVVNSDPTAMQTITLDFDEERTYTVIQEGVGTYYGTATGTVTLKIQAGEGVLVVAGIDVTETDSKEVKEAMTVYYEDIAPYRADAVTGVKENWAPTVTGYEFAGWFADEACTQAIATTTLNGAAYAKYVDAKILSVKTQLATDNSAIRFVSTIDSDKYGDVGFDIRYNDTNVPYVSTDAYMKLYAVNTKGTLDTLLPTVFSSKSLAFFAYTVTNVSETSMDVPFIASAYWTTLDGTKIYGDTVAYTINDAIRLNQEAQTN